MMKTRILAVAAVVLLAGCSTSESNNNADSKGETATHAPTEKQSSAPAPASTPVDQQSASSDTGSPSAAAGQADPFTMPNEVDKVLQTAQDDIQRVSGNPIYISRSEDALGKGRHQVIDSHWKVCSQTPAAGTTVAGDTQVVFQTVKTEESCP